MLFICEHCSAEFEKKPATKLKVQRFCSRYCQSRSHYLRNKEKISKYIKQKRLQDREDYGKGHRRIYPKAVERHGWYNEIKSEPCTDCKQTFPPCCMDFDHVRGEKSHTIGYMVRQEYSIERIKEEIAKCELVCANCHRIRTRDRMLGQPCYGKAIVSLD